MKEELVENCAPEEGTITPVEGGVCAARGFFAGGVHCGIRKNKSKKDLALICADTPCAAAAMFTSNLVKGAPLRVSREHLADGRARAIVVNSGIANTCVAGGVESAREMCRLAGEALGIPTEEVLVASTGVIGQPLDISPIEAALPALARELSHSPAGSRAAAEAVMTTDTRPKEEAVLVKSANGEFTIGGIAKGSGMIAPHLATMLVFLTTDARMSSDLLGKALRHAVAGTFNQISIDGDTSTNDTVAILASGRADMPQIEEEGGSFALFERALTTLLTSLSRDIARDGEGATKLLTATVEGAASVEDARRIAKSVIGSTLTKAAIFGEDANWGRILCAVGYAGVPLDPTSVRVALRGPGGGEVLVCEGGEGVPFSEARAEAILQGDEVDIHITLAEGEASGVAFGCDLSYEYVRINGAYRT